MFRTFVDEDCLPGKGVVPKKLYPSEFINSIIKAKVIPRKYWYWSQLSSMRWLELSQEKGTMYLSKGTQDLIVNNSKKMISDLLKDAKKIGYDKWDTDLICYVDLGSGDWEKEGAILDALTDNDKHVFFVPIDFSFQLLAVSVNAVKETKLVKTLPILGEFSKIGHYLKDEDRTISFSYEIKKMIDTLGDTITVARRLPRLFSLLGNTLGNMEFKEIEKITDALDDDGYMILDFDTPKCYTYPDVGWESKLEEIYTTPYTQAFVCEPLRFILKKRLSEMSSLKAKTDILESGVVSISLYYVLSSEEKDILRKESEKYELRYDETLDEIKLAWSSKYEKDILKKKLEEIGLYIVKEYEKDDYCAFLLRKTIMKTKTPQMKRQTTQV